MARSDRDTTQDFHLDREIKKLTAQLTKDIRSKSEKAAVAQEYDDHIRDAMQNYMLGGMTEEDAFAAARDDLGDLDEIAVLLSDVHNRDELPEDVGWKLDRRKIIGIVIAAILVDVAILSRNAGLLLVLLLVPLTALLVYLRAMVKRLIAVGHIRRYAKKHGMTCRVSYSAFTSLWLYADHADITLENQQQYYKIRFLPCVQPKTVLHFVGRNLYTTTQVHGASPIAAEQFSAGWQLFRPKNIKKLSKTGLAEISFEVQGDLYGLPTLERRHDPRDKEVYEVLIFNPVPMRVFYREGTTEVELVGGEQKDGVWLHDIVSFGSMLERMCRL